MLPLHLLPVSVLLLGLCLSELTCFRRRVLTQGTEHAPHCRAQNTDMAQSKGKILICLSGVDYVT